MKTTFLTILAALILSSAIAKPNVTAIEKKQIVTILTSVRAINTIEVHGNVELYISEGTTDQIKVYNKYYAESALVQSTNGVLRISSYNKKEKLIVWVTANDLRSVSAYDNAEIKSFGDISNIELNVDLHNNASAKLNINSYSATVNVYDLAKIMLSGAVNKMNLRYSHAENVNYSNLVTKQTSKICATASAYVEKTELDELADL